MKTLEKISTIPKSVTGDNELVIIPRKKYNEFLLYQRLVQKRSAEETDTDEAIKAYKEEKKEKKLKQLNSLAELD